MGITASQIRQDFSCFGEFGQQGYGYNVEELRSEIGHILGVDNDHHLVMIGVGNLGHALLQNFPFSQTGFSVEEIALAETATAATESIHAEAGEDGFTLESVLSDSESEEVLLEKISLRQAIEKLTEREAMVVRLRYFHGLTQQRVSKVLDVSQVQVSRIEKKALSHLREMMD